MIQKQMIAQLATELDMSQAQVGRWLKATMVELRASLQAGQAVSIPGWGTFDTSIHNAHRGFLPHEGRYAILPKRRVPVFRPSEGLREDVHDLDVVMAPSERV